MEEHRARLRRPGGRDGRLAGEPGPLREHPVDELPGFPAVSDLDLSAQTVGTTETFEACDTISAGDGFEVGPTGDVTFRAGNLVVLRDGFSVADGGRFVAAVDPTL